MRFWPRRRPPAPVVEAPVRLLGRVELHHSIDYAQQPRPRQVLVVAKYADQYLGKTACFLGETAYFDVPGSGYGPPTRITLQISPND